MKKVFRNYVKRKAELEEHCRKYCCGYEIRRDGSARVIYPWWSL